MRRHRPTIKEVAKRAGVSHMTVSRVLNNEDIVHEATRSRVYDAIRELNYRPSIMARGLANSHSLYIGLFYTNPSDDYLSELLLGTLSACRERQHLLMINKPDECLIRSDSAYLEKSFLQSSVQALIIAPPLSENEKFMVHIQAIQMRHVSISPKHWDNSASVCIDETGAAEEMTNYLIEMGHKCIGFIKGPPDHAASYFRYKGFQQAMRRHNFPIENSVIVEGRFNFQSGREAAAKILCQDRRPTAIFASNDDMACGVIGQIHEMGLNVPDDVSVVGFDDTRGAATIWPPLTTVRQPVREMAEIAVSLLDIDESELTDDIHRHVIPHKIIVRGSTRQII